MHGGGDVMERSDWLLLLLGSPTAQGDALPLDPVRVMKGLFLLIEEGDLDEPPCYQFEPYHYGPVSLLVYDDLADLQEMGMIEALPVPGYSWSEYSLSREGKLRYRELREDLPPRGAEALDRVKGLVSTRSFRALLRYVYSNYPDYAVNSVIGRM